MFINYITDEELKTYFPKADAYRWEEQGDYSKQLIEAARIVMNDLRIRDFDPRKCMPELELQSSVTKTGNFMGAGVLGNLQTRFVVDVTAITGIDVGTCSIVLEGSFNDVNYETVTILVPQYVEKISVVFDKLFPYYRVAVNISSEGASITYRSWLVDTVFDRLIVYKSLELIYSNLRTPTNEDWHNKQQEYKSDYEALIDKVKFDYDDDMDGKLGSDESTTQQMVCRLTR